MIRTVRLDIRDLRVLGGNTNSASNGSESDGL